MTKLKLLGISGSLRKGSTNTLLVKEAARLFGDAEFTLANLRIPLFDADLEEESGMPQEAATLYQQMLDADGIIISTPEYNKSVPGVLKNAFDWVSRKKPTPMIGKPLAILSAAAGRAGGERAQYALRHCLTPFRPRVLQGPEVMIAASLKAFGDDGRLVNADSTKFLGEMMAELKKEIARS